MSGQEENDTDPLSNPQMVPILSIVVSIFIKLVEGFALGLVFYSALKVYRQSKRNHSIGEFFRILPGMKKVNGRIMLSFDL